MTSADGVRFRRLGRVEEVGQTAPSELRQRSAVVIGCGALGTAAASLLVRMGVGHRHEDVAHPERAGVRA